MKKALSPSSLITTILLSIFAILLSRISINILLDYNIRGDIGECIYSVCVIVVYSSIILAALAFLILVLVVTLRLFRKLLS